LIPGRGCPVGIRVSLWGKVAGACIWSLTCI